MAEKNVSVKLSANVAPYQKAMAEASASTDKFGDGAAGRFDKLGGKMSAVGSKMTVGVTLPLLAAGAGAVKMSLDFDSSMSKITALVGIGADEVDGMKQSVLDLAGRTATAPQKLADALFVLTSAGLRGDDALSALEASAKASAAGLGETNDIARAVAGAMNAYGPDVLDAARATDILTATARAGNFETSQLAGALGRVLPFAKQAGASFEDVGGAVALLTRTNGNAAESITQVQALMRAFVVPTAEAAKVLGELGLSAADVRDSIGENGLAATLQMLDGKLGGNREQLGRLLGSSEAASAAFQILDADAATLSDTFGVVGDSVGINNEAFDTMADTGAVKLQQAWVDMQVAMIQVGEILGPIVADIAGGISSIVDVFSKLPDGAQMAVVGVLGIAAAMGPLLSVAGKLLLSFDLITAGLVKMKVAMLGHPILTFAAVAAAVGTALYFMSDSGKAAREQIESLADEMREAGGAAEGLTAYLMGVVEGNDDMLRAMSDAGVTVDDLSESVMAGGDAWNDMQDNLYASAKAAGLSGLELAIFAGSLSSLEESTEAASARVADLDKVQGESAESADVAAVAAEGLGDALDVVTGATEGAASATDENSFALQAQTAAAAAAAAGQEALMAATQEYIDVILASVSSLFDFESSVLSLDNAYSDYTDQMLENVLVQLDAEKSDKDKTKSANNLRQAEIKLAESALQSAQAFAEESGAADGSAESARLQIEELTRQAQKYPELREEIGQYINKLSEIPGAIPTDIKALIDDGNYAEAERRLALLERTRTARLDVYLGNTPGKVTVNGRASGGPVKAGHLYEVGEDDNAEIFQSGGRQYMIPGNDGTVFTQAQFAAMNTSMATRPPASSDPTRSPQGSSGPTKQYTIPITVYGSDDGYIRKIAQRIETIILETA